MGHVLQAHTGQSPARQSLIFAGLPKTTEAVTINKVCASSLKAVVFAAQNIQLGLSDVQVAGGMENMSRAPFYLERRLPVVGNAAVIDSLVQDGLWDVYNQVQ
jgi:acetyl-CoA C-acetyltransferase